MLPRFALLWIVGLLVACGHPLRTAAIPERPDDLPLLTGFDGVRAVDGFPSPVLQESFDRSFAAFAQTPPSSDGKRHLDSLILTAGGPNGAFGAGVLTAWTERGDRPEFWFVTGVSVGALLAPFAFAGPAFDERVEEVFGSIAPEDLHHAKATLPAVLWGESLLDNAALRSLIARGFDRELMRAVAAGHAEGRRLAVGTTNLDTGRFIIWDLGAIASRDTDAALQLCRDILEASAAVPVLYPPVLLETGEADELHVDGSVVRPFFIPQNVADDYVSTQRAGLDIETVASRIFVLNNRALGPAPAAVQRDTLEVAKRTVALMAQTMVAEHLLHLNLLARAWEADFYYVSIPQGRELTVESFTQEETERLFELGQRTLTESGWSQELPFNLQRAELRRLVPLPPADPRGR